MLSASTSDKNYYSSEMIICFDGLPYFHASSSSHDWPVPNSVLSISTPLAKKTKRSHLNNSSKLFAMHYFSVPAEF